MKINTESLTPLSLQDVLSLPVGSKLIFEVQFYHNQYTLLSEINRNYVVFHHEVNQYGGSSSTTLGFNRYGDKVNDIDNHVFYLDPNPEIEREYSYENGHE